MLVCVTARKSLGGSARKKIPSPIIEKHEVEENVPSPIVEKQEPEEREASDVEMKVCSRLNTMASDMECFLCPHHLRWGGHIDLPLSVCLSVRPSGKVCVARISETIAITDFKLQGYIVLGVNLCTWVFP